MSRLRSIRSEFVEHIPARVEPGVIYVSERFRTAVHLCCCGCGMEVVTPLNAAKWAMARHGGLVSLRPSIGNWSFPCRSHYWISRGKVRWVGSMDAMDVRRARDLDAASARREFDGLTPTPRERRVGRGKRAAALVQWLKEIFG